MGFNVIGRGQVDGGDAADVLSRQVQLMGELSSPAFIHHLSFRLGT